MPIAQPCFLIGSLFRQIRLSVQNVDMGSDKDPEGIDADGVESITHSLRKAPQHSKNGI